VACGGVGAVGGWRMTRDNWTFDFPRPADGDLPRTAAEAASVVRDAIDAQQGLRLAGSGTWLEAGHPVRARRTMSMRLMAGITSYNPADLTLTCGAGTTLAELKEATRAHGQWCPLAPPGFDLVNTIGATAAAAVEGPYAATFGRPRSLVLGLECVDGTGRIIAAGGRVVKNVAGFDLTRTMIGAWGTLGAITQVHLRLRALPAATECWSVRVDRGDRTRLDAYLRGPLAPLACMKAVPPVQLPPREDEWHMVQIGGNTAFVAASRAALRAVGETAPQHETALDALAGLHRPPARALQWRWDALSLRLRDRFDPHHILNPGLLGEPA